MGGWGTLLAQNTSPAPVPDTLRVAYYASPPFVEVMENQRLEGVTPWLWTRIMAKSNQPYRLVPMSLNDMLTGLARGEVDVSVVPLSITSQRSERIDFSVPFYVAHSTLMVRRASSFQKGLEFISSFFSLNFFRALGALFLVILTFGLLTWGFERRANPEEFEAGVKGIWSGIWWSAVTMTTVGYGDKSPRSLGGRIVALIWMFTAVILISSFTASITSSLTVNQLSWNLEDVMAFKERPVATVAGSATEAWLLRHFFRDVSSFETLAQATEALRQEEVEAVAYDAPALTHQLQADDLKTFELLGYLQYNPQLYALGFSENLPNSLKERINNDLLRLVESTDWKVLLAEYDLLESE
jgi:ABC-type amino acid transport substrate-binding protein